MNFDGVNIIQHGVKWILNGREPRCPDCLEIVHDDYELNNITKTNCVSSIGRKARWTCPECKCIFEYTRLFEEEKEIVSKKAKK